MTTLARKLFVTMAVAGLATPMATGIALAAERRVGTKDLGLVVCNGGFQEGVFTNTQNIATSTMSNVFMPVPSTTLSGGASGAAGDPDTYTVTFSGEAGNAGGGFWEIKGQVSVNGGGFVDLDPVDTNTFLSGNPSQTHTMTWCKRLAATNNTTFRVVWRKIGGGSAIVDGYLIQVQRSD